MKVQGKPTPLNPNPILIQRPFRLEPSGTLGLCKFWAVLLHSWVGRVGWGWVGRVTQSRNWSELHTAKHQDRSWNKCAKTGKRIILAAMLNRSILQVWKCDPLDSPPYLLVYLSRPHSINNKPSSQRSQSFVKFKHVVKRGTSKPQHSPQGWGHKGRGGWGTKTNAQLTVGLLQEEISHIHGNLSYCYTCFGFCTCLLPLSANGSSRAYLMKSQLSDHFKSAQVRHSDTKHGNAKHETQSIIKTNARKFQPKRSKHSVSVVALFELSVYKSKRCATVENLIKRKTVQRLSIFLSKKHS